MNSVTATVRPESSVRRWMTYLNERSPIAPLSFIGLGIAMSGQFLFQQYSLFVTVVGVLGTLGLLIQLRLGDELKDFEKDKIVHPERPLPRGLLTPVEVERALKLLVLALIGAGGVLALLGYGLGGVLLAITSVFGWLMYREFYVGERLGEMPMAYAFTHQVIVFPMYAWPTAMLSLGDVPAALHPIFVTWLVANFGASMTFEICRKLDPAAHALQKTYLHHYGPRRTALIIAFFVLLSIAAPISPWALSHLGEPLGEGWPLFWYLLPVQIPLLLSLALIPLRPSRFKVVEGLSILSATAHLWIYGILRGLGRVFGDIL